MNAKAETQSISVEYDLPHPPAKVWRAAHGWRASGRGVGWVVKVVFIASAGLFCSRVVPQLTHPDSGEV